MDSASEIDSASETGGGEQLSGRARGQAATRTPPTPTPTRASPRAPQPPAPILDSPFRFFSFFFCGR
eukprot:8858-Rhodomonas_salina.4